MPRLKLLRSKPPRQVIDTFQEGLDLPRKSVDALNAWLKGNKSLVASLDFPEITFHASAATGLSRGDVIRLLNVVFSVAIHIEDDAKLEDAIADLQTLDFSAEQLENFRALMAGLRFPESSLIRNISSAASAAIPTVQGTRIVCDLRAVFEDESDTVAKQNVQAKLRALVPVIIMTLIIEDENGDDRSVVFQLPEAAFARFTRELARAGDKLAQLNEIGRKASAQANAKE